MIRDVATEYPMGMTPYEQRELQGDPHIWKIDDDRVACALRINGHESWVVEANFHVGSSRGVQLVGLNISPAGVLPSPPQTPLTTDVLRSVRFDDLYQRVRAYLPHLDAMSMYVEVDPASFTGTKRSGRRGRPDAEYLSVAVKYAELVRASGSPTSALAAELNVSPSVARDLVHEARRRELLTPTTRGVKGGELTEKALKLLASPKVVN